ncbi:MAG TPA: helix-turn-helix transcriptional regulator [Tepidisphaeraceae bacterium]|jgi:transcriptional regulator with XRE-family HTH domain
MELMALDVGKLKALREAKGWTLQQAAEAAGLGARQKWSDLESGRRANPTIDTVQRMAKALGVKVDDLLK